MSYVLQVGDFLEVRIGCYTTKQAGVNTLHFRVAQIVAGQPTDFSLANNIDEVVAPLYKDLLSEHARYRGVSVQKYQPLPKLVPQVVTTNDGPGLALGDPLPGQVSGIISWKTARAGQRFRGRMYVPFPSETDNTVDGIPQAGYITRLNALKAAVDMDRIWGEAPNAQVRVQQVIFHRDTLTHDDVTSTLSRTVWASQRRRGDYGSRNPVPF